MVPLRMPPSKVWQMFSVRRTNLQRRKKRRCCGQAKTRLKLPMNLPFTSSISHKWDWTNIDDAGIWFLRNCGMTLNGIFWRMKEMKFPTRFLPPTDPLISTKVHSVTTLPYLQPGEGGLICVGVGSLPNYVDPRTRQG